MLTEYDVRSLWDESITDFVSLIESVEDDGESFTITREGKPVAVVISHEEWLAAQELWKAHDDHD